MLQSKLQFFFAINNRQLKRKQTYVLWVYLNNLVTIDSLCYLAVRQSGNYQEGRFFISDVCLCACMRMGVCVSVCMCVWGGASVFVHSINNFVLEKRFCVLRCVSTLVMNVQHRDWTSKGLCL